MNTNKIKQCACGREYFELPSDAIIWELAPIARLWLWQCDSCKSHLTSPVDTHKEEPVAHYKLNQDADINMTCLGGTIQANYMELQSAFGPAGEGDGYKISGEWRFKDQDGRVFTLYDYKLTYLYERSGPHVAVFRAKRARSEFHIGCRQENKTLVPHFSEWIRSQLKQHPLLEEDDNE